MAFALTACGEDDPGWYVNSGGSKLKIANGGDTDVLLYRGEPGNSRPFAGVRAGQTWGVPNAEEGLWVLTVVTQNNYDLSPRDPKISMSLLVYVDSTESTYQVSGAGIGNCEIVVNNESGYYVEVRENTFEGNLFLTVRPYEHASKFVAEKDYYLYPLVKLPQKTSTGKILGVYTKTLVDGRKMVSAEPNPGTIPFLDVTPDKINEAAAECLIYVYNQIGEGAEVRAGAGSSAGLIESTLGRRVVNSGNADPFVISRVPTLDGQGNPTQATYSVTIALKGFNSSSPAWTQTCEIGKVYSVTFFTDRYVENGELPLTPPSTEY